MTLETPIEYIKGIGPERAKLLLAVFEFKTVEDLLYFYPLRYLDKSKTYSVGELSEDLPEIQLKGEIKNLQEIAYGKAKRLTAQLVTKEGILDLVWFKYSTWMKEQIPQNRNVFVFGKINAFNHQFSMAHPEIELEESRQQEQRLIPVYPGSEKLAKRGINQNFFRKTISQVLTEIAPVLEENLPEKLIKKYKLISRKSAFINIHFPKNIKFQKQAERKLKFDEAFFFQLSYGLKKNYHKSHAKGHPFTEIGPAFNNFFQKEMPFELTNAQKKVLKEIRNDLKKSIQMNRLLQGDVGSGKTMVALLSMLLSIDNGFQNCLMAPTEILAQQHYNGLKDLLRNSQVNIRLLTGSTKTNERKEIHEHLQNGTLDILVGTHAVLEDRVQFKNLGLAIIDEQHRFGVAQRSKLWAKNKIPPHILIMTATPIPRTLAMSFYSDLDVSVIDEMPMGRKPIITAHRREKDRTFIYRFCLDEIKKGRQIYFVYPLIEESEVLDFKNLMHGYDHLVQYFNNYHVEMLHGKMKPEEKDQVMQKFAKGKIDILVSTTVIEVGVNVPNASVMVIESAEKFGLSQLHQLRGRVGRGSEQSYCILLTSDKLTKESRFRLKTMCETNDGFLISEADLKLRGAGDMMGTQQSGSLDFKKLDLTIDGSIIKTAKEEVSELLRLDPLLSEKQHQGLKDFYIKNYHHKHKWSKIS